MKNQSITICLPESLVELLEDVKQKRRDPTRSDTVRALLLLALGKLSYLPPSETKALGLSSKPRIVRAQQRKTQIVDDAATQPSSPALASASAITQKEKTRGDYVQQQ
jgi:Arc/MetJ-type ribon-helix-helix transcriptional regulator